MENTKTLLLDADFIAYFTKKEDSLRNIEQKINDIITGLCDFSETDNFIMAMSSGPYIKNSSYPSYKARRPAPNNTVTLTKCIMRHNYAVFDMAGYEADDLVLNLKQDNPKKYIIASCDKDIYDNIEGKHVRPFTKLEDGTYKHTWVETTAEQADYNFYKQLLMGDYSDCIESLKSFGEATAKEILSHSENNNLSAILDIYINGYKKKKGLGPKAGTELFTKNYYLLSPLQISLPTHNELPINYKHGGLYLPEIQSYGIL